MTLQRRTPLRSRRVWRATDAGSHKARDISPAAWRLLREACRDRAAGGCQAAIPDVCTGRGFHAHHLLRRGQGGPDELDNLAWVCEPCHGEIHKRVEWSMTAGLLRSRYGMAPWPWTPDTGVPPVWPGGPDG